MHDFLIISFLSACNFPREALQNPQSSCSSHIQRPVLCCAVFFFVMVCLPVVDHFHVAVLLDPELPHNYVVNAARRICPCVGFVVAADKTTAHMVSF